MNRIVLLAALSVLGSEAACAQSGLALDARVGGDGFPLGTPIVLTVRASNHSESPAHFGVSTPFDPRLSVSVRTSDAVGVPLYPRLAEAVQVPAFLNEWTATPPGGTAEGDFVLDELFDIYQTGDYVVDLSLVVGADTLRRTVTFKITPPPGGMEEPATSFVAARRAHAAVFTNAGPFPSRPPLQTFTEIAADHGASYLGEPALYHSVAEGVHQGVDWSRYGDVATGRTMLEGALERGAAFLDLFPTSLYVPSVVRFVADAHRALGRSLPDIVVGSVCQGRVYNVVNLSDVRQEVEYRSMERVSVSVLTLKAGQDTTLTFSRPIAGLVLSSERSVLSAASANLSTCSGPYAALLSSPSEKPTGEIVVAGPSLASPHAVKLPHVGPDLDSLGVGQALDLVIAYDLSVRGAVWSVRRAGLTGDRSYVPVLKQIASAYASVSDLVSFNALWALLDLREPRGYVESIVREWRTAPDRAAAALLVLSADPTTAFSQDVEAIKPLVPALDFARSQYLSMSGADAELAAHPVREQLDLVLVDWYDLVGSCESVAGAPDDYPYPFWVAFGSPDGELDPSVQWARNRFLRLATRYPSEADDALNQFADSGAAGRGCTDVSIARAFADYAAEVRAHVVFDR